MAKCKTDFKGCCCNVDGECTYWVVVIIKHSKIKV